MNILLIGGAGFIGSHLAAKLVADGHKVLVPTRRYERAKHLLLLPTADIVVADIHNDAALARLVRGHDAVVNLVGILKGGEGRPYGEGFKRAHVDLPHKIAHAVQEAGVPRLLHMSALGADGRAPSGYLRSKAAGEAAAFAVAPPVGVTVFRPSVVFGKGDSFLSLFARLLKLAPVVPLACAHARFQPVWVEDVAAAFATSLARTESAGVAFDLCGPRTYSLRELVEYVGRITGRRRPIVPMPDALAYLQAWAFEFLPGGPLTRDNLRSMQVPNVCEAGCTLPFGLKATPLEAVAPGYLTA